MIKLCLNWEPNPLKCKMMLDNLANYMKKVKHEHL